MSDQGGAEGEGEVYVSRPSNSQGGLDPAAKKGGKPGLVSNLKEMHPRDERRHFRYRSGLANGASPEMS